VNVFFAGESIQMKYGDTKAEVLGHRSGGQSVTLSFDGCVSVQGSFTPTNARALAAQLIAAADHAEGKA
jgi:hypothetical protein